METHAEFVRQNLNSSKCWTNDMVQVTAEKVPLLLIFYCFNLLIAYDCQTWQIWPKSESSLLPVHTHSNVHTDTRPEKYAVFSGYGTRYCSRCASSHHLLFRLLVSFASKWARCHQIWGHAEGCSRRQDDTAASNQCVHFPGKELPTIC